MTFIELAEKVLKEEKKPLLPGEIWELAMAKGYANELDLRGKTPWATLGARLYVDVKDNPNSLFAATGSRPKRFYLRSLLNESSEQQLLETAQSPILVKKKFEYTERDLHPFLVYYGYHYLRAHLKTIRHAKSEKKAYGEWVHPDIVGCYFPFDEWKDEVVEFSLALGNPTIKLYSFELKRELNFSNLREAFFQAVSNSSWANEGYLVASEIFADDDFLNELQRLSTSFGIGIIRMDIHDPDSTEIIFPAKPKEYLDWDTLNKLTMNPDFRDFLKRIKRDISSKEVIESMYDKVLAKEELIESIKPTNGVQSRTSASSFDMIEQLLANPLNIEGFKPFTREEIYEQR